MFSTLISSIFYLVASLLFLFNVREKSVIWSALIIALSAHAMQIVVELPPMPYFEIMRMLSLIVFIMNLVAIGFVMFKSDSVACMVTVSISAILVWMPFIFPSVQPEKLGWEVKLHAALSIAAYVALSFSALYAIVLLVQDYKLRNLGKLQSIHLSLDYVERIMFVSALVGELLLSLSLLSGLLFIEDIFAQHIVHKMFFSLGAWVIIGSLLLRYHFAGLRDRVAAIWLLSGFAFIALAYFGSNIVLQLVLHK